MLTHTPLPAPEELRELLSQDTQAINHLQSLLIQERELLEQRQHEPLPELIATKNVLQEQLAHNAKLRERCLAAAGHQSWETFLLERATTRELIQPWKELGETFIECQRLNDINGKLISRSRQTLGQLLNLVRGQVAGPQLYTPTGGTAQQTSSQTVTKA